jgi:hypothetical protein
MHKTDAGWRVIDVILKGTVSSWRSGVDYTAVIDRDGFAALEIYRGKIAAPKLAGSRSGRRSSRLAVFLAAVPDRRLAVLMVRAAHGGVEIDRGFSSACSCWACSRGDEAGAAALDRPVDELIADAGGARQPGEPAIAAEPKR